MDGDGEMDKERVRGRREEGRTEESKRVGFRVETLVSQSVIGQRCLVTAADVCALS
jgi:hypothetical protein